MGSLYGITNREQLEEYGIPTVMLLDNTNDSTGSGAGHISGSEEVTWEISWDNNGFTGYSFKVPTWNRFWDEIEEAQEAGSLETWLRENEDILLGIIWQIVGNGNYYGCADHS